MKLVGTFFKSWCQISFNKSVVFCPVRILNRYSVVGNSRVSYGQNFSVIPSS